MASTNPGQWLTACPAAADQITSLPLPQASLVVCNYWRGGGRERESEREKFLFFPAIADSMCTKS